MCCEREHFLNILPVYYFKELIAVGVAYGDNLIGYKNTAALNPAMPAPITATELSEDTCLSPRFRVGCPHSLEQSVLLPFPPRAAL